MLTLVAGLVLFLGIHGVAIINEPWRDRMAARMGEIAWKSLYGVVALAGLILIIQGYSAARFEPMVLYSPPTWLRHLTFPVLLLVFPLLFAAYFPGRIKAAVKHPMLLAVKLWALTHLIANGTLADVLLFGAFLAWAVVEWVSLERRAPRTVPVAAALKRNDLIAVLGGLVIYVVFAAWLHEVLIGVPVV